MSFLIDTNHVDAFYLKDDRIIARLASIPAESSLVYFSSVTVGEIEAGHQMNPTTDQKRRLEFITWVKRFVLPKVLKIEDSTAIYYGNIMGEIWRRDPPANESIPTEKHLVGLHIDVNDIWSVAVAWEHNLTFVTKDRMAKLRAAVPAVRFDCWL